MVCNYFFNVHAPFLKKGVILANFKTIWKVSFTDRFIASLYFAKQLPLPFVTFIGMSVAYMAFELSNIVSS